MFNYIYNFIFLPHQPQIDLRKEMFGIIWINCLVIAVSQLTGNLMQKRESGCIHILHVPARYKGNLVSGFWIPPRGFLIQGT